jgi:outer membrane receptor for ferrienterochelin and colicins
MTRDVVPILNRRSAVGAALILATTFGLSSPAARGGDEPAPPAGGEGKPVPAAPEQTENVPPQESEDLTGLSLEELMVIKVDTVYGASRRAQKETDAPSSVTVIDSDEIRKQGHRTLAEVLRSIRGLFVTNDRYYDYLGVRGFGLPGDYNTRVLVLVDGHRVNDNLYETGAVGREFILDVDLIDRVEFIRGPSSSLYGTDAFFGVINVITKKGGQIDGPEASASAGTFRAYQGRGTFGKKLKNGLEMLFSATGYTSKGQTLYFKEFDDPATGNGYASGADDEYHYNLFSTLSFRGLTLQAAYVERDKSIPTSPWGTIFPSRDSYAVDARHYVDLKYENEFDGLFNLMARVSYDGYEYHGDYLFEGEDPDPNPINRDTSVGRWWGGELKLSRQFIEQVRLTLGGEFQDDFRQDQDNYDVLPYFSYLRDRRDSFRFGVYGQAEVSILKNLTLNAGVRYDHFETFGGSVNPRAGLMYSPLPKTTFKLLYGRAFRAPNVYELYYHDGWNTTKPSEDLDPETIETYEFVYDQYLGKNLRFIFDAFHNDIRDLIALQVDPADDLLIFRNADDVESNGIELGLEGKWVSGLRGRASYSFQNTEYDDGHRLTNSPHHMAKLSLIAPLAPEKLFAGLELQYMSRRKTLSGRHTDDNLIANITIFSENIVKDLEFSASVYNLFDTKFHDPGSGEHIQDEIEQDGIGFRVKLTYRF